MPPKLPADHPSSTPDMVPDPEDRRDLVEPRPPVEEEIAWRDETAPPPVIQPPVIQRPVIQRLAQDLAAAASPLVPEAGVAEGPGAGGRRNRPLLLAAVVLVLAAVALLLIFAT